MASGQVPRERPGRRIGADAVTRPRVVIAGIPRAGKTTLAEALTHEHSLFAGYAIRHTDDTIGSHAWSAASAEVATWLDLPGPWIIEGVAMARALRKWLAAHPEGKPCEIAYWLDAPLVELTPGQTTMAKGCRTVFACDVHEQIRARGVEVRWYGQGVVTHPIAVGP